MSTLGDAVTARTATSRLAQLTQLNDANATTVDTTQLNYAVTDTTAEFETYAMEDFDSSNAQHLALGIAGVIAFLEAYKGQDAEDKRLNAWRERVKSYARTSSRARIMPLVTPGLGPRSFPSNRPYFDVPRFADGQAVPPTDGGDREP